MVVTTTVRHRAIKVAKKQEITKEIKSISADEEKI